MGLGAYAFAGAMEGLGMSLVKLGEDKKAAAERKRQEERDDRLRAEDRAERRDFRAEGWARDDSVRNESREYEERQRQDTINRGASALTSGINYDRASYVRSAFIDMGYPEHVADGLVGNILQESGPNIDTGAVGDNGNAFGMAQWNGPRRKAYLNFAKEKGVDPEDIDTQIAFLDHEMRTTEKDAFDAIMATSTSEEAALVASQKFWRPGIPHNERRQAYARRLAEIAADPNMPATAREQASQGLTKLRGLGEPEKLTGEEWIPADEPGKEMLIGYDERGNVVPRMRNGKPIVRSATKDTGTKSLSSTIKTQMKDWFEQNAIDQDLQDAFTLEVQRLVGEGMTEDAAWIEARRTANKSPDVETTEERLIFPDKTTVTPGSYDGTFGKPRGLGAPEDPSIPSDPDATGMPQPQTKAELDKLPKGTRYIAPDGSVRVKS